MGECGLWTPALLEELAGAGSEMPACRGHPVGTWQGTLTLREPGLVGSGGASRGAGREGGPPSQGLSGLTWKPHVLQGVMWSSPAETAQALKHHPTPAFPPSKIAPEEGQGCAVHCFGRKHVNSLSCFQLVTGLQGCGEGPLAHSLICCVTLS